MGPGGWWTGLSCRSPPRQQRSYSGCAPCHSSQNLLLREKGPGCGQPCHRRMPGLRSYGVTHKRYPVQVLGQQPLNTPLGRSLQKSCSHIQDFPQALVSFGHPWRPLVRHSPAPGPWSHAPWQGQPRTLAGPAHSSRVCSLSLLSASSSCSRTPSNTADRFFFGGSWKCLAVFLRRACTVTSESAHSRTSLRPYKCVL